jgi:predicted peptidase
MRTLVAVAVLISLSTTRHVVCAGDSPQSGRQQPEKLDHSLRIGMQYLLYLPQDYDSHEKWPLLLFLHGGGERGDDIELLKIHGPPKLIAAGKQFPMIVVSPQCPKDQRWQSVTLLALLDELCEKLKVDHDRIYLTGLSMGGYGLWALAFDAPDRFAALAPICGGGEPGWAKTVKHIPVWAFHGELDEGVPLRRSQEMVDALKKEGANPRLTIFPGVGHISWNAVYDDPAFYEWLLAQKRMERVKE